MTDPPRLLGEAVDHGEAEAGALSVRLRGEERLHHPRQDLRRHAAAGIGHRDDHVAARHHHLVESRVLVLDEEVLGLHGDRAAARHGVAGVQEDVEQRHLGLGRVDAGVPEVRGEVLPQDDVVAQRPLGHLAHALDEAVDVEEAPLQPLLAREGEQLMGQLGGPLGGVANGLACAAQPPDIDAGMVDQRQHHLVVARDDLQEVVEIVRDAARELPEALHLLGLMQALLRVAAAGHVELRAEEVDEVAGAVEDRRDEQGVPEGRAVLAVVQDLGGELPVLGDRGSDFGDRVAVGVRPLEEAAIGADQLLPAVAGHADEGAVDEEDRVVGLVRIGDDHRHARRLDGREEDVVMHVLDARRSAAGDGRARTVRLRLLG